MQNPSAILLDLDFTIAHLNGGYETLYEALTEYKIPRYEAKTALRKTADSVEGFTLESYVACLAWEGFTADWSSLLGRFEEIFQKRFALYPDVLQFLESAKSLEIPLILVTSGHADFQKKKIDIIDFPFDEVCITTTPKGKADYVYKWQQQTGGHVWFVDDKRRELVRVFETPKVKKAMITCFEIDRPDRSHKESNKDPRFVAISSFEKLTLEM